MMVFLRRVYINIITDFWLNDRRMKNKIFHLNFLPDGVYLPSLKPAQVSTARKLIIRNQHP